MDYTEKTFPLKNGKTCLIRRPEAADAERVLRYQKETSGETPYLVVGPEDIGLTVEEQAELEVVSTNAPAVGLYRKLGFEAVGTMPRALKYQDGTYADFLLMVRTL